MSFLSFLFPFFWSSVCFIACWHSRLLPRYQSRSIRLPRPRLRLRGVKLRCARFRRRAVTITSAMAITILTMPWTSCRRRMPKETRTWAARRCKLSTSMYGKVMTSIMVMMRMMNGGCGDLYRYKERRLRETEERERAEFDDDGGGVQVSLRSSEAFASPQICVWTFSLGPSGYQLYMQSFSLSGRRQNQTKPTS